MKTLIVLLMVCLLAGAVRAADLESAPVFQMRLVADGPSADTEPMVVVTRAGAVTNLLNIQKAVLLDQTALKSAHVGTDSFKHPIIEITFTKNGTEQFATITGKNVGKSLAIVIDGRLYSAPVIRTAIPGGKAVISGDFSKKEAEDLARKISGAAKK